MNAGARSDCSDHVRTVVAAAVVFALFPDQMVRIEAALVVAEMTAVGIGQTGRRQLHLATEAPQMYQIVASEVAVSRAVEIDLAIARSLRHAGAFPTL